MARSRVLSFMSTFGHPPSRSPPANNNSAQHPNGPTSVPPLKTELNQSSQSLRQPPSPGSPSTPVYPKSNRQSSRPGSMIFQQSPVEVGRDTLPELLPIFTFLNSHANKLYQEGYFLKLNDLDTGGRPTPVRNWTECFAQLVGTVLSLWDAAALDAAGQDGEVPPTFVNLADASIKMIETLPTRKNDAEPLHNVLSISTAGKNRYLLHFNSLHSLTQWTAGIRLAMFEHASLQELYTGSLIAGKGKELNNIRTIMERTKFKYEDWARVRFGAGTAWQRYWMVISPPDEKEVQRHQKALKKRSAYERPTVLKGDIKFYETKKIKKATPIATIKDAYAAYAIYPQSKPLIEQSTLVKIEGKIIIHSTPESTTEGFVFVMANLHAAVSGFEMLLRTLFPTFDVFGLYGRPNRLIADTLDPRGIMFAMPKERRYGYLDIIDVAALIHTDGSQSWTEREWRRRLREATSKRMTNAGVSQPGSRLGSRHGRHSRAASLQFRDNSSVRSNEEFNRSTDAVFRTPKKVQTAPPAQQSPLNHHSRSASDNVGFGSPRKKTGVPTASRLSMELDQNDSRPPTPPLHLTPVISASSNYHGDAQERSSSEDDHRPSSAATTEVVEALRPSSPPAPAPQPPAFAHQHRDRPQHRPSGATDSPGQEQLPVVHQRGPEVNGPANSAAVAGAAAAWKARDSFHGQDPKARSADTSPIRQPLSEGGKPANLHLGTDSRGPSRPKLSPILSAGLLPDKELPPNPLAKEPLPRPTASKGITRKPVGGSPSRGSAPAVPAHIDTSLIHTNESSQAQDQGIHPARFSSLEHRERPGVLKTVGGTNEQSQGKSSAATADLPIIDFGPTQALRPTTKLNIDSKDPKNISPQAQMDKAWNSSGPRDSGNAVITGEELQARLENSINSNSHASRPSSRGALWSPGAAVIGTNSGTVGRQSLTPEEFVQQRSAAQRKPSPVYGHSRNQSSMSTSSLPLSRPASGDWTQSKSSTHIPSVRPSTGDQQSRDHPPRPHSRGASVTLSTHTDFSAHLSAREQEHVARLTGTPLVNLPPRGHSSQQSQGLIGAIEAREQEKKNFKDGVSNQLMQQAIAQRQQQAQSQPYHISSMPNSPTYQQLQAQSQPYQMSSMPGSPTYQQIQQAGPHGVPGAWGANQMHWTNPQTQAYWTGVQPRNSAAQWDPRTGQYYTHYSPGH